MEDARGDAALGAEDARLELDGVGQRDVGHGQLDRLEVEAELAALAAIAAVVASAVVAGGGAARRCVVAGRGCGRVVTWPESGIYV